MLYLLDLSREDWVNAFDGAYLTQVLKLGDQWLRPFQTRELTDPEVELPRTMAELPGFDQGLHERLRYGYSDAWQQFITASAQAAVASQPPPHPLTSSTLAGTSSQVLPEPAHLPGRAHFKTLGSLLAAVTRKCVRLHHHQRTHVTPCSCSVSTWTTASARRTWSADLPSGFPQSCAQLSIYRPAFWCVNRLVASCLSLRPDRVAGDARHGH